MAVRSPERFPAAAAANAAFNPRLVRAYDLRGAVGCELMADDAYGIGLAYAALARSRAMSRIAVAYDGRLSSPALEAALVDGLVSGGMHVQRLGLGPTPQVSFAVHMLGLDGGVMITGSHNPANENGFKLLLGGAAIHGPALQALARAVPGRVSGGRSSDIDVMPAYLDALANAAAGAAALNVAWDSGNGATGPVVERLTAQLPGRHVCLHTTVDGRFPSHHPDPSVPANLVDLQAVVAAQGCDLGIAFDGDGDRIGVVDATGAILCADQLLLLLARGVLAERPGATIVADVKSSRTLFDGIAAAGGRPVMGPSGYVLVRETMQREAAPLAGEMSGHIFFSDRWHGSDDALYVAMRLLTALAHAGVTLAEFRAGLPAVVATPELRLFCPDARKVEVIEALAGRLAADGATVDRTDGVRVSTVDGWWLLRASGTEPKLTARCEASDAAGLFRLRASLADALHRAGLEIPDT